MHAHQECTEEPVNAPSNDSSSRLLSVDDTGLRLGVSRRTVWKWIRAGRLPVVRFGERTVRIREADLGRFIALHVDEEAGR